MRNSVMLIGTMSEPVISEKQADFTIIVNETERLKPMGVSCSIVDKSAKARFNKVDEGDLIAIDGKLRIDDGETWIEVNDIFLIDKKH